MRGGRERLRRVHVARGERRAGVHRVFSGVVQGGQRGGASVGRPGVRSNARVAAGAWTVRGGHARDVIGGGLR